MFTRVLTTVSLWLILAATLLLLGFWGGVLILGALAVITQAEVYDLFRRTGLSPRSDTGLIVGTAHLLLTAWAASTAAFPSPLAASAGVSFAFLTFWTISRTDGRDIVRTLYPTLLGFFLVPFALSYLLLLARAPAATGAEGLFLAVWVVAVAKFTDVGALLIGMWRGRHLLAPNYSPKKTIEGSVGGVLVAVAVGVALPHFFPTVAPAGLTPAWAGTAALIVSVVAQASDLLGSSLKRRAGVKDSGHNVPGIGGGLDLTDSLLLAAPVGYLLLIPVVS